MTLPSVAARPTPCGLARHGLAACLLLAVVALASAAAAETGGEPVSVLERYLAAVYARDYAPAYDLISTADRQYKTREEQRAP